MNNSQFNFFTKEWPAVKELINKVEVNANNNPEYCCLNARKTTEFLVQWIYQNDYEIKTEYKAENSLSYLIHNRDFRNVIGQDRLSQFKFIKDLGNRAAHLNKVPPSIIESTEAASELFKICKWFYQRYSSNPSSVVRQTFKKEYLPKKESEALEKIKSLSLAEKLKEVDNLLKESERKQSFIESELIEYKQRVTELIKRNKIIHKPEEDITEVRTRKIYIDHYLIEAGWRKDISWSEEVKVYGMPNNKSAGYVDYVLWGEDGKPLALVEAKRSTIDPKEGQQQAKLYADCLEREHGQRPIIFLSNGYKHIIWDDLNYPQREIQGFYKKDELEVLIRRRDSQKKLNSIKINEDITDRFYQIKAIKSIVDSLENKKRKALLVMATGTGKTRTIISLCELLIRSNSIKRVLFLADRTALVNQAEKAFKKHLPACSTVNLVTNKSGDGRIFISTYPTILNIIDNKSEDNQRRFGVGHFDLVIIDEAHRSIYQKYHSIFEYFDSLLIGLTATPRSEIDRNTYRLFDLEIGKPTEEYGFKDAVKDKFLTKFKPSSIPLKFVREGIRYEELDEDEKIEWDEMEWDTETVPDYIYSGQLNNILFNADTVDKVLNHLLTHGLRAEDTDRIGKTIIFAKNQKHAEFIEERFNINYPHLKGKSLRVISHKINYVQSLIDDFSDPNNPLDIAVSIDMLDTGIDIPQIVNLVFFKLVRSKTKFWQMIGRGTRLCKNLFGPGEDKKFFWIFDYCQNLEYFSIDNGNENTPIQETISSKLFKTEVEILQALDKELYKEKQAKYIKDESTEMPKNNYELRSQIAELLKAKVASCNKENFIVKPNLEYVERFEKKESWFSISQKDKNILDNKISKLPFQIDSEDADAKRFDLLVYKMQLALLNKDFGSFNSSKSKVIAIANRLLEKENIPIVSENLEFIEKLCFPEWWQDINLIMLEDLRRKIRNLLCLLEIESKKPLYTNFKDTISEGEIVNFEELVETDESEKLLEKIKNICLKSNKNLTLEKLKKIQIVTEKDLNQLEEFLVNEIPSVNNFIKKIKKEENGIGLFIRKLIGIERDSVLEIFSDFLNQKIYSQKQIQFITEIINYFTQNGDMDIERIYEQPFNEITTSPEDLFKEKESDLDKICSLIQLVKERANSN